MKIVRPNSPATRKLYHRAGGEVIRFADNDGTDDPNTYLVAQASTLGAGTHRKVVCLSTGAVSSVSVTRQTVLYPDATLMLDGGVTE